MNSDFRIVSVERNQIDVLAEISRSTFEETFSWYNTKEDMVQYLSEKLSLNQLTDEWLNVNSTFYLLYKSEKIIGYLKINRGNAQTEKDLDNSIEIERVYISKEYQGIGAGQILVDFVVQLANIEKLDFVWLAVWEKNEKAINFYRKNNFEIFGEHDFVLGSDVQKDLLMKLI